ncbi:MAG: hypothetical protein KA112_03390 [Alphaproteobacteria bacterium]|nr:hypothetical protein [Alphaproteobacteria bacterium]MBP7729640.1 hypothetical protein [Alphaproteobacteria bacterium]
MSKRYFKIIGVASIIAFTLLIETKTTWGLGWGDLEHEDQLRIMLFHARGHTKDKTYRSYMPHGSLNGLRQKTENDIFYVCKPSAHEDRGDTLVEITGKNLIAECNDCTICDGKIAETTHEIRQLRLLEEIKDGLSKQTNMLKELVNLLQSVDSTISNVGIKISEEVKKNK